MLGFWKLLRISRLATNTTSTMAWAFQTPTQVWHLAVIVAKTSLKKFGMASSGRIPRGKFLLNPNLRSPQCSAQTRQSQESVLLTIASAMAKIASGKTQITRINSVCCESDIKNIFVRMEERNKKKIYKETFYYMCNVIYKHFCNNRREKKKSILFIYLCNVRCNFPTKLVMYSKDNFFPLIKSVKNVLTSDV